MMNKPKVDVKRLEVWVADLGQRQGSVQGGVRPICILQNDVGNKYSPTVTIAPLTTSKTKKKLPTHISLKASEIGLEDDSILLIEQITNISKSNLMFKVAEIPSTWTG